MLKISHNTLTYLQGQQVIHHRQHPIPIVWLEDLLELSIEPNILTELTVIIITVGQQKLALVVEALLGEQKLLLRI